MDILADYTTINLTKRKSHLLIVPNHFQVSNETFVVDVLDTFPMIRVAVAYITPEGERITSFPADLNYVRCLILEYTSTTHSLVKSLICSLARKMYP